MPEEIEAVAAVSITRERKNDVWYLFVGSEEENEEATLVLHGATTHTLEEVERGFDDALGAVSLVTRVQFVVGGERPCAYGHAPAPTCRFGGWTGMDGH